VDPLIFSTFLSLGAAGCVDYLVAQLIREITFHLGVDDPATGEAGILQRLTPLDQVRAVLILLGFSFIPILAPYAGAALRWYRVRPAASLLGFACSLLRVGLRDSIAQMV
jgi:hypothetical protein